MLAISVLSVLSLLAGSSLAVESSKEVVEFINREVSCRVQVVEGNDFVFIIAAGGISLLSIAMFAVSLMLFLSLSKKMSKQVAAAETKAQQLMDAVLVALIPMEILKGIGSLPDDKKQKTKEDKAKKEKTDKDKDKTEKE
uniref:Col_cuticle_N domain-containing protein n=1 Tax=Steinernema glaseri TaxID=37863 RepID=A0A1I8AI55_9BILA